MSFSLDGIIYYGFPLPDYFDDDEEFMEKNRAWANVRRPKQPADRGDYNTPEWDAWRVKLREWQATAQHIEIDWSGGEGECAAFYVHACCKAITVEWNEQAPLADVDLGPQPDADKQLELFCDQFGIEWQTPGWYLAARYF